MTTRTQAEHRQLGSKGLKVFPLALGCMGMSGTYGPHDEREGIATIHAALDRGVNLLDTGDYYNAGRNELLIGRALRDRRDEALVSVKFGALRSPDGAWLGIDTRPVAVKNSLGHTLSRLGLDHVDIYRPGRLDPMVPIEDTIGAIAEMVQAGWVRAIGLSEVGPETIRRAHAVHPIADVQLEWSLVSRSLEAKILPVVRELGIGITAYGALSRGLLTGSAPTARGDLRAHLPRFSAQNLERNRELVERLRALASEKRCTPAQLAIAWVIARGEDVVPVIGARTPAQLEEALGALEVELSAAEADRLAEAITPEGVAGSRYDERQMNSLDSER